MKIGLVCSHGGHLTELLYLLEAFEEHDIFFVTYENPRTKALPYKTYLLDNIGTNPLLMASAFPKIVKILRKEKPETIVSTGSEIAIPTFYVAKLMGIRTIFIESWCRVTTQSGTGKLVYPVSDQFLVQWPGLLRLYGPKARYVGAVVG
jgi:beta-1,4-N-acetylglucosaminyltransferase